MPKCLVPTCLNYFDSIKKIRRLTFFAVPDCRKNPSLEETTRQWLAFCNIHNIDNFVFSPMRTICEKHFEQKYIVEKKQHKFPHGFHGYIPKRLKKGVVPTILAPSRLQLPQQRLIRRQKPDKVSETYQTENTEETEQEKLNNEIALIAEDPSGVHSLPSDDPSKPLARPLGDRKEAADLARYPPDLQVPLSELYPLLSCGICNGFFYNATTITVCLHTFCKGCLVKHFTRSLHCPRCKVEVHPSDPYVNMRTDSMVQDLANKVFPQFYKEERRREAAFYESRGLTPPQRKGDSTLLSPSFKPRATKMVSVMLDYVGTTPHLPVHQPLMKNFLRVPDSVTVGHLQKFVEQKLRLALSCQAAMFVNFSMLHESLSLQRVEAIFGQVKELQDLLVLQFGIIPKGEYFRDGLVINMRDVGT